MTDGKKCAADDTRIAGEKTISDWKKLRENLLPDKEFKEEDWEKAFDGYFMKRLETRYFRPIRALEAIEENAGEGFSIVALYCSLIEFLQATREGKIYNRQKNLSEYEYDHSGPVFKDFLTKNIPFKNSINEDQADLFYKGVRNGLLHEARTKGQWKILLSRHHFEQYRGKSIDCDQEIVFRDKLGSDFYDYLKSYRTEILGTTAESKKIRSAFIRKFNNLCDLPIE